MAPEAPSITTAAQMRADFLAYSPARQRETIAYVQRLLAEERDAFARQRRRAPSPLARIAFRVYGVHVDWIPPHIQEDPMPARPFTLAIEVEP